jgi:hypothetical protein
VGIAEVVALRLAKGLEFVMCNNRAFFDAQEPVTLGVDRAKVLEVATVIVELLLRPLDALFGCRVGEAVVPDLSRMHAGSHLPLDDLEQAMSLACSRWSKDFKCLVGHHSSFSLLRPVGMQIFFSSRARKSHLFKMVLRGRVTTKAPEGGLFFLRSNDVM